MNGLQYIREQGRQEGELEILSRLLALRFGPLDPAIRARLDGSTAAQRAAWSARILTAPTVDAVFADDTPA